MSLAQHSSTQARDNDRRVLEVLVAAGDRGLEPGQVVARAGLATRTFTAAAGRLEARGLVARDGKRRVHATVAGKIEVGAAVPGVALAPAIEQALRHFPTEAHRAFVRLKLSAVVARHHLHQRHDSGWAGFIALGGTGTGKTAIATFVAVAFGLDPGQVVRMLRRETPGSVFARRRQQAGGSWTIERAKLMDMPFVALDEYDKAPETVRQEAGGLLLGSTQPDLEGKRIEVRPSVMVMLNVLPGRLNDVLPEEFVRRGVVLYTTPLQALLRDLDEHMHQLFTSGAIPRVRLDRLDIPAPSLPSEVRTEMRAELMAALTDEGWRLCDIESLSRLALGRAALTGDGELRRAALAVALDYLYAAITLGHVRPGFDRRLAAKLGRGPLLPDTIAAGAEADRRHQAEQRNRVAVVSAELEFVRERERVAGELIDLRRRLGRPIGAEGKAIIKALAAAVTKVRGCRSRQTLDATWAAAQPYLSAGHELERERHANNQRRQAQQDRRQTELMQARAARQQRQRDCGSAMRVRRTLREMMPCDGLNELMLKLTGAPELAEFFRWVDTPAPDGSGRIGKIRHAVMVGPGHWTFCDDPVGVNDARIIWEQLCRAAELHVLELGGPAAKLPSYRERRRTL